MEGSLRRWVRHREGLRGGVSGCGSGFDSRVFKDVQRRYIDQMHRMGALIDVLRGCVVTWRMPFP